MLPHVRHNKHHTTHNERSIHHPPYSEYCMVNPIQISQFKFQEGKLVENIIRKEIQSSTINEGDYTL